MLLFLTRDARLRFSIEERLAGDGEVSLGSRFSALNFVGDAGSLLCQNPLGEFEANGEVLNLSAKGEVSNGEESSSCFCRLDQHHHSTPCQRLLTFVFWFQLGEFRRRSIGLSSASGRWMGACFILVGDDEGVPLWMRNG